MRFGIALNMERLDPREDMRDINKRVLVVLRIAKDGAAPSPRAATGD